MTRIISLVRRGAHRTRRTQRTYCTYCTYRTYRTQLAFLAARSIPTAAAAAVGAAASRARVRGRHAALSLLFLFSAFFGFRLEVDLARDLRQSFVRFLLFIECLSEQILRVLQSQDLGERCERTVAGDLVVFDLLCRCD